jgi:hypothetical protein
MSRATPPIQHAFMAWCSVKKNTQAYFSNEFFVILLTSLALLYEGRLQSPGTHLITPSWNFVEVQWRSLFRSTSLGKQCSTHFSKTCSIPLITSKFLAPELPFHGWKSPELHGGCSNGVPPVHFSKPNTRFNSDLAPCDFWAFQIMKSELWGKKFPSYQRSAARFREVGGAL